MRFTFRDQLFGSTKDITTMLNHQCCLINVRIAFMPYMSNRSSEFMS